MSVDLSTLSLFPATQSQTTEARRRTLSEWGKGLTLNEHLARDAAQDQLEVSREGRFFNWVLAPRDDPQTLDFKCACETFQRTGLVKTRSYASLATVPCYAIASVFTPPEHRGKGFARHMLRLLHYIIADPSLLPDSQFPTAWGAPPPPVPGTRNAHFSTLWSDVGHFYKACGPFAGTNEGWVVKGTATTVWDVQDTVFSAESTLDWTWLDDSGVSQLWQRDAAIIRSFMSTCDGPSFTYLPTEGVAAFQHKRKDFYFNHLTTPPPPWGVSSPDRAAYATWMIDPPRPDAPRTLTVTRLHVEPHLFAELVARILEVARKHDVTRVEIWSLPAELRDLSATLGAETHERTEHLPALKWYGTESEEEVAWMFNERFCWC